jgi:hypothetical protein
MAVTGWATGAGVDGTGLLATAGMAVAGWLAGAGLLTG